MQTAGNDLDLLPMDLLLAICGFLPVRSILAFISSCRRIRSQILPHVNAVARQQLLEDEPWLLPAGPFVTGDKNHGREEVDWWTAQWAKGGVRLPEMEAKIPWVVYRRECGRSMSMWNRRRIWGVANQIETLAMMEGLL